MHDVLSSSKDVMSFTTESAMLFQQKKEKSKTNSEAQKNNMTSYVSTFTNTMASSVSSLFSYFGGGGAAKPQKEIKETDEDRKIKIKREFIEIQHKKLDEIFNCLHETFENRLKQSVALREMSEIFNSLSNNSNLETSNQIVKNLKTTTESASKKEEDYLRILVDNVEVPLEENRNYLKQALDVIDSRTSLKEDIERRDNDLDFLKKTGKDVEAKSLEASITEDRIKLKNITKELLQDLEKFERFINADISEILSIYVETQSKLAAELVKDWSEAQPKY